MECLLFITLNKLHQWKWVQEIISIWFPSRPLTAPVQPHCAWLQLGLHLGCKPCKKPERYLHLTCHSTYLVLAFYFTTTTHHPNGLLDATIPCQTPIVWKIRQNQGEKEEKILFTHGAYNSKRWQRDGMLSPQNRKKIKRFNWYRNVCKVKKKRSSDLTLGITSPSFATESHSTSHLEH